MNIPFGALYALYRGVEDMLQSLEHYLRISSDVLIKKNDDRLARDYGYIIDAIESIDNLNVPMYQMLSDRLAKFDTAYPSVYWIWMESGKLPHQDPLSAEYDGCKDFVYFGDESADEYLARTSLM